MAMLIGNLGGKQELQRVARCRKQERPEQAGHIELGVEAVGEDPKHARLIFAVEGNEARSVDGEVESKRRPTASVPSAARGWPRNRNPFA